MASSQMTQPRARDMRAPHGPLGNGDVRPVLETAGFNRINDDQKMAKSVNITTHSFPQLFHRGSRAADGARAAKKGPAEAGLPFMAPAGSHWIAGHGRRGLGRRRSAFAPAGRLGGRVTCCRRTIAACAVQDEANDKQDSDNSGRDIAGTLRMVAHVITRRDTSVVTRV